MLTTTMIKAVLQYWRHYKVVAIVTHRHERRPQRYRWRCRIDGVMESVEQRRCRWRCRYVLRRKAK